MVGSSEIAPSHKSLSYTHVFKSYIYVSVSINPKYSNMPWQRAKNSDLLLLFRSREMIIQLIHLLHTLERWKLTQTPTAKPEGDNR